MFQSCSAILVFSCINRFQIANTNELLALDLASSFNIFAFGKRSAEGKILFFERKERMLRGMKGGEQTI